MKRLHIRLLVLLTVFLLVLVPLAHAQDEGIGYTDIWRQWRQNEIRYYPTAELPPSNSLLKSAPAGNEALGYTEIWRQWRMREIQSSASD